MNPTLTQLAVGYCLWKHDEWHDYFDSSCGQAYCFEYEFKVDDSYKFCPACGKLIQLAEKAKEPEDDE